MAVQVKSVPNQQTGELPKGFNKAFFKHAAVGLAGVFVGEGASSVIFADGLRNIGDAANSDELLKVNEIDARDHEKARNITNTMIASMAGYLAIRGGMNIESGADTDAALPQIATAAASLAILSKRDLNIWKRIRGTTSQGGECKEPLDVKSRVFSTGSAVCAATGVALQLTGYPEAEQVIAASISAGTAIMYRPSFRELYNYPKEFIEERQQKKFRQWVRNELNGSLQTAGEYPPDRQVDESGPNSQQPIIQPEGAAS